MSATQMLELLESRACQALAEPLGPGLLQGRSSESEGSQTSFPLQAVDVQAHLAGPLASVEVNQTFANPFSDPMEATYIFPLPTGSAVYRFRLRVGDRVVEGQVKERGEARQEYREGLRAGHRSALLEQERDNVFTVQVGNVPAGEQVTVELAYAGRLERDLSDTTFRFPLVVAPRYIPGAPRDGRAVGRGTADDTDRVPDASRLTPPILHPGLHSGANLSIRVELEAAGLLPDRLACSQHATSQSSREGRVVVELARQDELLDRDFVLRFRLAGEQAHPILLCHEDYFLLDLVPPREVQATGSRDVLFLLDRSGSMGGTKMASARRAVERFLEFLDPGDRFGILAFDTSVEAFEQGNLCPPSLVPEARGWLGRVEARGGTEILAPLQHALAHQAPAGRVLCVVLITDGQVGNEPEIYRLVQEARSQARVFSLGIDTAVNDAFLRRIAQLGRGTCELVTPGEDLEAALQRLGRETGQPLLLDVTLRDRGLGLEQGSLAPEQVPDLFAARPSVVLGRKTAQGDLEVAARRPDGSVWSQVLQPASTDNPALRYVWARERVTALEDRLRLQDGDRPDLERQLLALALEHQILTRLTAFVLVDRSEKVQGTERRRDLVQPVQLPAQWEESSGGPVVACGVAPPPAARRSRPPLGALRSLARESFDRIKDFGRVHGSACSSPAPQEPAIPADPAGLVRELGKCLEPIRSGTVPVRFQRLFIALLELLHERGLVGFCQSGEALLTGLSRALSHDPARYATDFHAWLERVARALGVDLERPRDDRPFWTENL